MFKSETQHVMVTSNLGNGDLESFIDARLLDEPHIFPDISLSLLLLAQFFDCLQGDLDLVVEVVAHQLIEFL